MDHEKAYDCVPRTFHILNTFPEQRLFLSLKEFTIKRDILILEIHLITSKGFLSKVAVFYQFY